MQLVAQVGSANANKDNDRLCIRLICFPFSLQARLVLKCQCRVESDAKPNNHSQARNLAVGQLFVRRSESE
eukprot:m.97679 g.97679  ORF g.97679 m.97679 type:complete len:71 (+) comp36946_c0_seq14:584-796(+)